MVTAGNSLGAEQLAVLPELEAGMNAWTIDEACLWQISDEETADDRAYMQDNRRTEPTPETSTGVARLTRHNIFGSPQQLRSIGKEWRRSS